MVWLLLPSERVVEVWLREGRARTLTANDELSGEDVIPDFTHPVANLFP
jgi:hypothetical protein